MLGEEKLTFDSIYYKENKLYGLLTRQKKPNERNTETEFLKFKKVKIEVKIDEVENVKIWLHNRVATLTPSILWHTTKFGPFVIYELANKSTG